jgi:hypothetical protein
MVAYLYYLFDLVFTMILLTDVAPDLFFLSALMNMGWEAAVLFLTITGPLALNRAQSEIVASLNDVVIGATLLVWRVNHRLRFVSTFYSCVSVLLLHSVR